ncbi:ribosome biogenesis protein RLP24 [Apiospora phragmitis]|uniref:Ribosome biogenesis protein RLP24 n=1 Tax=Apiospora phragmitis TaxID=2905665 RepID=A0ABR1TXK6_9PEZI
MVFEHPPGFDLAQHAGCLHTDTYLPAKCHKNFKMKRNPRKLQWTKAYRKAAGKEMTVDSTLQYANTNPITGHVQRWWPSVSRPNTDKSYQSYRFAARRNVPVRYNRELWQKTMQAMSRISEIRSKRERVFYRKRMAGKRARELANDRKLVQTHSHLLPRMRGSEKRRLAIEQGLAQQEINRLEEENVLPAKTNKAFGKEKIRQKVRIDGGVEEEATDNGMDIDSE